jgi:hypothetical protein
MKGRNPITGHICSNGTIRKYEWFFCSICGRPSNPRLNVVMYEEEIDEYNRKKREAK